MRFRAACYADASATMPLFSPFICAAMLIFRALYAAAPLSVTCRRHYMPARILLPMLAADIRRFSLPLPPAPLRALCRRAAAALFFI